MVNNVTEDIWFDDGSLPVQRGADGSSEPVTEAGRRFQFRLCRKEVVLGQLPLDHWWMDVRTVYGQRNRSAANQTAVIECWWAFCWKYATVLHEEVQQSYILAHLLPYARGNGSRRVLVDAIPTRTKELAADKATVAAELERCLQGSQDEEHGLEAFRDMTANAIGPPVYGDEVWQCYNRLAADLLGQGCTAIQRDGQKGLEVALKIWKDWMKSIGRHRGHEIEKAVLDILSYECRAALHRCYSHVWDHLSIYLARKYGLTEESVTFHRFWHLDQQMHSNLGEKADFHLFHGHVFALHPAGGNFMLTESGRRLMGQWLSDPHSTSTYQRLLHGLAVAVHQYAVRNRVYAELRKKQPEGFGGLDLPRIEEQEVVRKQRRRVNLRRNTDAI
jgi:hypothetical protein